MTIKKTLVVAIDPSNNDHLAALQALQDLESNLRESGVVISSSFDGETSTAEPVKTETKKTVAPKKETAPVVKEEPKVETAPVVKEEPKVETAEPEQPEAAEPEQPEVAEPDLAPAPEQPEQTESTVTLEQIRALISEITSDDAKRVLAKKALNELSDENGQPCKNAGMLQKKDYDAIFATFTKIKNGTYEG